MRCLLLLAAVLGASATTYPYYMTMTPYTDSSCSSCRSPLPYAYGFNSMDSTCNKFANPLNSSGPAPFYYKITNVSGTGGNRGQAAHIFLTSYNGNAMPTASTCQTVFPGTTTATPQLYIPSFTCGQCLQTNLFANTPYTHAMIGGNGCVTNTTSGSGALPPAPPATCPAQSDLDETREMVVSLTTIAGVILTGGITLMTIWYLSPSLGHVEKGEGFFWWAHMFIAGITVVLTAAALATKEIYKYTVTVYCMYDVVIYINYWKLHLEVTGLPTALVNAGVTDKQAVDVTCCIMVNLPSPLGAVRLISFSDMDSSRCGHLQVLQATTAVVLILSFFAVCAFMANRFLKDTFPRAGLAGRLAFAVSSLVSVLSIVLTADLRSKMSEAVSSSSFLSGAAGELVYGWGYFVWLIAMIIKLIAALLVIYEVYFHDDDDPEAKAADVAVEVDSVAVDLETKVVETMPEQGRDSCAPECAPAEIPPTPETAAEVGVVDSEKQEKELSNNEAT